MLARSKLNSLEVLISKVLISSNITYEEIVLIRNLLKVIWKKKSKIFKHKIFKRLKQFIEHINLSIKQGYCIVSSVEKIQKVKTQ